MLEADRQTYEYHITILCVRMKVKFPSRMKIEHAGMVLTSEVLPSEDSRFLFNQEVVLRDANRKECFELTVHLLTDKGSKYIAGIIKLYHSEMIRSEGQKLVLSMGKCIDNEAFCEIRVDQVSNMRQPTNAPYDRRSILHRNLPPSQKHKDIQQIDLSPFKNTIKTKNHESRSQFQFPIHAVSPKHDWESKSKGRYNPPETVYKGRPPSRINIGSQEAIPNWGLQRQPVFSRQKAIEGDAYKQGYEKLKEKYRRQAQVSKNEMSKRLALQSSENSLKLELMRLKLRVQEQDRQLNEKTAKIKELQIFNGNSQQKDNEIAFLRDQVNKRQKSVRMLEQSIYGLNGDIEELRMQTKGRNIEEINRSKSLRLEVEALQKKLADKDKEIQRLVKAQSDSIHTKDLEIISKTEMLEREKRIINDLQRNLQNKNYEIEKQLQNDRNNSKNKVEQYKTKSEKLEKEVAKLQEEKKELVRKADQLRNNVLKVEYDRKLLNQEHESTKGEVNELRVLREKLNELSREHRAVLQERAQLQKQVARTMQSKETSINELKKEYQDQLEYYKRMNREIDEKNKNLSSKLVQVEGQLDLSRTQQQKFKRNIETLEKQARQARQKEKNAKRAIQNKQQESLGMQTQYVTLKQKVKNIDHIYKMEADKLKMEIESLKMQLDRQSTASHQYAESNNHLTTELNRVKMQLQFAEDRAEKESLSLKEKQLHVETLIRDYEEQITSLEQSVTNLRQSEKQLSGKVQRYEVDSLRWQQKIEKAKKDVRILEERCNGLQQTLRSKNNEINTKSNDKDDLIANLTRAELELSQLKLEHTALVGQKSRIIKIVDILHEEARKTKAEIQSKGQIISSNEKKLEETNNQLVQSKQEYLRLELKFSAYKKEIQRNKEHLSQSIYAYLVGLPASILSVSTSPQQEKKSQFNSPRRDGEATLTDLINLMTNTCKDLRLNISKQNDHLKITQRENERIQQELTTVSAKCLHVETTLKQQIDHLQAQLDKILQQKASQTSNFTAIIEQLSAKLKQKESIEEELHIQIEQLNFSINSIKMDCESINDLNNKKVINLRKLNTQLEEKCEDQQQTIADLDDRCSSMQNELGQLNKIRGVQADALAKKERLLAEMKEMEQCQQALLDELKKQKKEMSEKLEELEMHLSSEREMGEKIKQQLEEQQKKCSELKAFVANLMKQKEMSIKNEVEKNENMMNLQSSLADAQKEIETFGEQLARLTKNLENQKELNKIMSANLKEATQDLRQQKNNSAKYQERLKEKERQVINKDESMRRIEQKHEKTYEKLKQQIRELQEELQSKSGAHQSLTKDTAERITNLQTQLQKKTNACAGYESQISELEELLYMEKDKSASLEEQLDRLKREVDDLRVKICQIDSNLNELNDELRDKQQKLFDVSGKNYSLELKIQAKEQQKKDRIQQMQNQWMSKYVSICEQYDQRLEMAEKQKDYFKSQGEEKEREIIRLNNQLKSSENADNTTRKLYEQKIKKIEDQKLFVYAQKNEQLQRISSEAKSYFDNLKAKESEVRRMSNELEVTRKTIMNLEFRQKQSDDKIKSLTKTYQAELEQLKKKDQVNKAFKEAVSNYQWNTEREIKKSLQNFIRNFLEVSNDKNSQKIIELVRTVENSILEIVSSKFPEK